MIHWSIFYRLQTDLLQLKVSLKSDAPLTQISDIFCKAIYSVADNKIMSSEYIIHPMYM